jgi:hypothetical protein
MKKSQQMTARSIFKAVSHKQGKYIGGIVYLDLLSQIPQKMQQ